MHTPIFFAESIWAKLDKLWVSALGARWKIIGDNLEGDYSDDFRL